ncbi:hypothetical protein THII_3506 [Thioploca ingrica]|uniref:Uncharacterized protein n=1 Tax=Thioploca ingrica TaxID=40754 RepID=A0A090AHL4_9GAMM|nr:hypothetical protein THII_3506 [Thioploca ingrica]
MGLSSVQAATDCTAVTEIPQAECETLIAFYNSTNGAGWSDSATNNWNVTNTPCSWTGIFCSDEHIITISRYQHNLAGPIPDLSALTQLHYLWLYGNQLTGAIPDLSALTQLQHLLLQSNQLTGPIPNLSALTQLQALWLYGNQLTGAIPDLSALTQLQQLYLSYNQLCGEIPSSLVNLKLLTELSLRNNHLTASDPTLIAFLNSKNLAWTNQTPYACGSTSPPSTPLPLPIDEPLSPTLNFTTSDMDCDSSQSECSNPVETTTLINLIPTAAADSQLTGELLRFPLTITTVGQGQVSSAPVGIHCGDQCQSLFDINTNITLTAIPEKGWQFQEWSGDCDKMGTVVMKENQACQATFKPFPPSLRIITVGQGQVSSAPVGIDCGAQCQSLFDLNTNVTLTAIPEKGWQFLGWSGDCDIMGTVVMKESKACQALFFQLSGDELLPSPLIITTVGQGQVSSAPVGIDCGAQCQSLFDLNTNVTLTAIPEKGWLFQEWSGDCNNQGQVLIMRNQENNQTCQVTFFQLPLERPPIDNAILTACANAITWDGQSHENAVVKNTDTLNLVGRSMPIKIKALCNYGTIQETAGELLSIQVNPTDGFIYNEGRILGKDGKSSTAKSTPTAKSTSTTPSQYLPQWANGDDGKSSTAKSTPTTPSQGSQWANGDNGKSSTTQSTPTTPSQGSQWANVDYGQSNTAKSTLPTNGINEGDNGSDIKLNAGTQLYHLGIIQAGAGGNGYLKAGDGGSVEIYANNITQAGIISAGHGGEGNARQPAWDRTDPSGDHTSFILAIPVYGNQPVWGGKGGKTILQAQQSLNTAASATTSSGTGGNAYVWCTNGAHLIAKEFDGRWYTVTCVSDDTNIPLAIPTPGTGGDLIQLSPAINDVSSANSGKDLYYEPSTITMGPNTRLQAQEDIFIFGGDDWILDLRNLSPGAISTPGNITLAVGKGSTIDLRGNTSQVFQAGGQFTVFTDNLLLDNGISLENLVAAQRGIVTNPSKILHLVILTGPKQLTGEPQATLPIELELINGGPEADTYNLTVSDSAGWNLPTLPATLSVAGLGHETLMFNLTFPAMIGEKDAITITATSSAEPTITSSTEIVVTVVGNQIQPATTASETAADSPVELPLATENASLDTPAANFFSSLPPETPPCYASGLVDWVCNAHGQTLTDLIVGPNGMIANGMLMGTLTNQGWVSNLTLEPQSHLTGGIVTGYIINHGEMADFEFRGAAIVGGTLAGDIFNTSQVGGYFHDVQLAAGTYLSGGQLGGEISGDAQAPALLEDLAIQAGSYLEYVTIGEGVELAATVTFGEGVQFNNPSDDPRLGSK